MPRQRRKYNVPVNVKQVAVYLTHEQKATLDRLHELTDIPRTVLLRRAVDALFREFADVLKKGAKS